MALNALQSAHKRDRGLLQSLLMAHGSKFRGNSCTCLWHDDKHPSAGLYLAADGWRFKCMGCGLNMDVFECKAKLDGIPVEDQLRALSDNRPEPARQPEPTPAPKQYATVDELTAGIGNVEACYQYTNPDTRRPDMVVIRYQRDGGKAFIQARPDGDGFVMRAPPQPWPIYNRTRVRDAGEVWVVEGEKCVHALTNIGIVATTSPGGALKAGCADWTPLAGKTVYLWPDFDPIQDGDRKGYRHMREVAAILEKLNPAPRLLWIDADNLGLPDKGDAADFLDLLPKLNTAQKRAVVDDLRTTALPMGASREVIALIQDEIDGKRVAIPWPWQALSRITQALLPGTVTLICGDPGATKSLLVLDAAAEWNRTGVSQAIYELEEDRPYHLKRVLAQLAGNSELTVSDWVRRHGDEARNAAAAHATQLDGIGRSMTDAPDKQVTLDELLRWVEDQCKAGKRLIVIDPITAAEVTREPWAADSRFLIHAKALVRRYKNSLILVTHPKKGGKDAARGLDGLAGGAAYPRFSQTVLWVEAHAEPKQVECRVHGGITQVLEINRTVRVVKARNGIGTGQAVGFWFEPQTLRFTEQGVIVPKRKRGKDGDE